MMSKEAFFETYRPYAAQAAAELQVPESAILAHWATETAWGKSIVPGTNNLGNIKDVSKAGTGVAAVDNETKTTDRYRKYADLGAGTADYVDVIKRLHKGAIGQTTARGFAESLKASGYFTSPHGVANITRIAGEPLGDIKPAEPDERAKRATDLIAQTIQRPIKNTFSATAIQTGMESERWGQEVRTEGAPSLLESAAAAWEGNTDSQLYTALKERIWGPKHPAVEGFSPDFEVLKKATNGAADRELVDDYGKAKSPDEAAEVLKRWQEEQERVQAVMANGKYTGLALSFAAEVPTLSNLIPAVGAAKTLKLLGMGSEVLAARGAGFSSVAGSAITENVLSGTAVEALRQGLTGHYSLNDLALSATVDSVFGLGVAGLTMRGVKGLDIDEAAGAAVRREVEYAQRAEGVLGSNATAQEMRETMDRLMKGDVEAPIRDMHVGPAEKDKLVVDSPHVAQADEATEAPAVDPATISAPESIFHTASQLTDREAAMGKGGAMEGAWAKHTGGVIQNAEAFAKLGKGLHVLNSVPAIRQADVHKGISTAERLIKAFLPEHTITLRFEKIPMDAGRSARGSVFQTGAKGALIRIDPDMTPDQIVRSVAHEVGHVVFNSNLSKANIKSLKGLQQAWKEFAAEALSGADGNKARAKRFSTLNPEQGVLDEATKKLGSQYELDFDEYLAEQYVKYLERDAATDNKFGLSTGTVKIIKAALARVLAYFKKFGREAEDVDLRVSDFLDSLMAKVEASEVPTVATPRPKLPLKGKTEGQADLPADVVQEVMTDPDAVRLGLTIAPMATGAERKQAQAILALYKQAERYAAANPKDAAWDKRAKNLSDNAVFNVASIGLTMLKSENPLMRMIASQLVEDASGVAGKRQATASIKKEVLNRAMMGNVVLDIEGAYSHWAKDKGGSIWDDMVGGRTRDRFHKAIAAEIEARRLTSEPVSNDPNLKAAVDSIEAAYQRIANAQREADTLGAGGLPESSRGYMPHRMSPKAVIMLTNEQTRILHGALTDQFMSLGWDTAMADKVASSYIKRVRDRASGDYGSAVGGQREAASLVEEALRAMDLPDDTVKAHMDKFSKGGAGFTKKRIELDLNQVHDTADGEFRLLDVFETDPIELLRAQAGRASGEVALTMWGVRGTPGLKLLRDALEFGEDGKKASVREKEAFDQMAAEFMNEPFGTQAGKYMQRAMGANSLVRLGGLIYTQAAETINAAAHVGVARMFSSVVAIPRLHREIKDLVAGKHVDNPFLKSIELAGGAEFGTHEYKMVMPFDSPNSAYPSYGKDTLTLTDRLIRGGGHLQSKLSGWRFMHSVQQRGMAEQIVHKMMRYIREGKDDVALQQFGITPELRSQLRADLHNIASFDGGGNLTHLDVTKISDPSAREQVIQAVWRGTSQIIQGTFIGERGKWAHDGWMQLLTQFRTFPIVSMEKQWGRQRNSRGAITAGMIVLGSMCMVTPIYMARVYASSIGRPDQDDYIRERMEFQHIARATMNYVSGLGMAGDFVDLLSAPLPEDWGVKPTGGRSGLETDFVGNYVAPASSLVDSTWKYAQSPLSMDDAAKITPLGTLPYLLPFMNSLKDAKD